MKRFLTLILLIMISISLVSCKNETLPQGTTETAKERYDNILKIGRYEEVENGLAGVILKEDNEFIFVRHLATNYTPRGSYSIEDGSLIMRVDDKEEYIFLIDGDSMIFERGTYIGDLLKKGDIFQFSE